MTFFVLKKSKKLTLSKQNLSIEKAETKDYTCIKNRSTAEKNIKEEGTI